MRFINAPSIRNVPNVGWQIMLEDERWHTCRQEIDARFIANGVAIANSVIRGERAGEEVARELDQAAASVSRHIGECETGTLIAAAASHARLDTRACDASSDWVREDESFPILVSGTVVKCESEEDRRLLADAKLIVERQVTNTWFAPDRLELIGDACERYSIWKYQRLVKAAIDRSGSRAAELPPQHS
ncbi:hypothetical protein [Lacipirellula parvula]|uniref:Uncharacterized protein n=1 Tax=Lacipirellula parvula TaxID=2650471 RepID=A0A5K7XBS0_9BACT|nr:hypothetical protein [Lacipirellula parvula]BBO33805.1 hypothetical protein PLANPX_3417 [Lacipirellula parvula]